ncbi:hypothetical protein AVEN_97834-1 [Araneus ventricosus]|uniref:Uncharacterized protein n=1 Tax=Araneus ventricosus TaxID=182803 RepID=A0A4Y2WXH8_ARAVE|nr:hypothetical protein AVEN_97834-1 [Araneus ventricosus]
MRRADPTARTDFRRFFFFFFYRFGKLYRESERNVWPSLISAPGQPCTAILLLPRTLPLSGGSKVRRKKLAISQNRYVKFREKGVSVLERTDGRFYGCYSRVIAGTDFINLLDTLHSSNRSIFLLAQKKEARKNRSE